MLVTLKWKVMGAGKNSAQLIVTPWLAYGCSVGARISTETGFATVTSIKDDDTCEASLFLSSLSDMMTAMREFQHSILRHA